MARRDWYCEDVLSGKLEIKKVWAIQGIAQELGLDKTGFHIRANVAARGVTPPVHWHIIGPGIP